MRGLRDPRAETPVCHPGPRHTGARGRGSSSVGAPVGRDVGLQAAEFAGIALEVIREGDGL